MFKDLAPNWKRQGQLSKLTQQILSARISSQLRISTNHQKMSKMLSRSTSPAAPPPPKRPNTSQRITTQAPPGLYQEVKLRPPHKRSSHKQYNTKAKRQTSIRHWALSPEQQPVLATCRTISSRNSSWGQRDQQAQYSSLESRSVDSAPSQAQELQGGSSLSRRRPRMKDYSNESYGVDFFW